MVKFSKELEAQLIPEWKDKFVNYWQLKKRIKMIKLRRGIPEPEVINPDFGFSIFDSVRYVLRKTATRLSGGGGGAEQHEIIQVKNRGGDEDETYETDLVQLVGEGDDIKQFFEGLDEELNKVNHFHKTTESEFLERGEILRKQLQILLDLKQVIHDRRRKRSESQPRSNSSSVSRFDVSESVADSTEASAEGSPTDGAVAALERNGVSFVGLPRSKAKKGKPKTALRIEIPATTPTRAIMAVTSMLWEDLVNNRKKENPAEFITLRRIQCAEKMIRGAFVELYKGLGLLKTYSSLNMLAFTKILKKFDKVAKQQASATYLKAVKRSHFISSDKVVRLADEVESIFTKHFANNDRKKAMKYLKPQQHKDSHIITFLVGLFTGCFITSFGIYAVMAHLNGMFSPSSEPGYMEAVYPIFSMFALLSLHVFLYGCNLFMWKNTRINYIFIFDFSPRTAIRHRDAFLICTSFMTIVVSSMIVHLILRSSGFLPNQVDAIPGLLFLIPSNVYSQLTHYVEILAIRLPLTVRIQQESQLPESTKENSMELGSTATSHDAQHRTSLSIEGSMPCLLDLKPDLCKYVFQFFAGLLICPLNIFYRSSRYCCLRVLRNIICSPFYKVLMVDFFMADQLTSQIPLLRHMEFTACYFIAGVFKTHHYQTCSSSKLYKELAYVISFMPYYWRAMQCARRWFDEGDVNHLANLGKYVSALLAAGARLTFAMQPTPLWLAIVIITSSVATVYQLYWDFMKDWGFLNAKSRNPWLRDDLVLKQKSIYYVSIAFNFVLRLAWVEAVMHINLGRVNNRLLDFFLASLEIIRRGHWNFYRLENEHLNNAGKFRAVKAVPLPFQEIDSDN